MVKAGRVEDDLAMEQETQQHPKENSQKKRRRWPPSVKQVRAILTAMVAVTGLLALGMIVYFFAWQIFVQAPWWTTGVVVALVAAVLALAALSYQKIWEWLGFGEKGKKTGLDLIQVAAALSIPIVVLFLGIRFTAEQSRVQLAIEEERTQDAALEGYFDQISQFLSAGTLQDSQPYDEIRASASARTLTVLKRLNGERKGRLLQFLYESKLIEGEPPRIILANADLRGAKLQHVRLGPKFSNAYYDKLCDEHTGKVDPSPSSPPEASLPDVDLSGADLSGSNLAGADLSRANLSSAVLKDAILTGAKLEGANANGADLRGANVVKASMPDDLRGADLRDIEDLTDSQLVRKESTIKGDEETKLPDHVRRPSSWGGSTEADSLLIPPPGSSSPRKTCSAYPFMYA